MRCPSFCRLGSPPRMRGKEITYSNYSQYTRITPAHAGKRNGAPSQGLRPQDHPRACGEKIPLVMEVGKSEGSPPRMRGKAPNCDPTEKSSGITPAHAGKRGTSSLLRGTSKDHPRACGEKALFPLLLGRFPGSPPRMRGKVFRTVQAEMSQRITPAHAGKRLRLIKSSGFTGDHPRACGEK